MIRATKLGGKRMALKKFVVLVSKVMEGEIPVVAETEEAAREIALDLGENYTDEHLVDGGEAVVEISREADADDVKNYKFFDAKGNEIA